MADATLKMVLVGEDRGAGRTLNKVGKDADNTGKHIRGLASGLGEMGARMSSVITIGGAVGPAILAVGSAASAASAGVVALGGAIGPALAAGAAVGIGSLLAVKQATLVSKLAFDGLSAAIEGQKGAMKALTPEGRSFAKVLKGLKPELKEIQRSVQAGLFPGLTVATSRLATAYFPLVNRAAAQTGAALGRLAKQGSAMVTTGPWRKDFGTVTRANTQNIGLMGKAGLSLADAARSLLVTALPVTHMFLTWAGGAAKSVDQFVQAKRASGELAAFWLRAADTGHQLGVILGNLGVALFNIFKVGGGGAGKTMLANLEGITLQFRNWTQSTSGIAAISQWFDQGRQNLAAMGRLLGSVSSGLASMGSGKQLAPLLDQINKQIIPPLMDFLHNASVSGALSALVDAMGQLLQVIAKLEENDKSMKAFAVTLGAIARAAEWVLQNVPGAASALGAFLTVMGANKALKIVGLGGVVESLAGALSGLATKLLIAAGAETTETGAVTANTLAHSIATSTAMTWIGVKYLELTAWVRGTAAAVANTVAVAAQAVGMKIAAVASKTWAAAQWLLNAALTANPIGLVIVAIAALVAGLIYAYKHSEAFRNIVNGAFTAVKKVAGGVLSWLGKAVSNTIDFVKAHWKLIASILTGPIGAATIFIVSHFGSIKTAASNVVSWVRGIPGRLGALAKNFGSAGKSLIGAFVNGMKNAGGVIAGIAGNVWSAVKHLLNGAIDKINAALSFKISLPGPDISVNPPNIPHLAAGTQFFPGGIARVGERGPETVYMPRGVGLAPNGARESGKFGGDFLGTFAIDVTADGKTIQTKLLKLKRQNGNVELGIA